MLFHSCQHAEHENHQSMAYVQELLYWLLMVAAMMVAFILNEVRAAAIASLWARRHRAIAGFLLGYFAPWLVLGIVAAALRDGLWSHTNAAVALAFVVAAIWQRTSMHARALAACHRRLPLAPIGWRADRDCLRFGGTIGIACVWSCWPLMLACTLSGHALVAMIGGVIVTGLERWSFRPRARLVLAGTLALAGYFGVLAALE